MKKLLMIGLCFVCVFSLAACGGGSSNADSKDISTGGSTSMQELMEKIADKYNKLDQGTVTVQGGGSSVGIQGAIEGTFDVANSSRALKSEEAKKLDATTICLDGIAVVVNPKNGVKNITMDQLKQVFTGAITNWKELGGVDKTIKVVAREEGSGTRDGFESIVGMEAKDLVKSAEIQNATGSVVSSVAGNQNAIGYISLGALTSHVSALTVDGVQATEVNVSNQTYKLQRPFVMAVKKDSDVAKKLFDFIFSKDGKKIIEDMKYVPVEQK